MRYGFINNFSQTLAADLAAGATTMTLDGGGSSLSNASADLVYTLTLDDGEGTVEIVHVTGATANDLTISKGQEGTADAAWPSGTTVEMRVTAGALGGVVFADEDGNVTGGGGSSVIGTAIISIGKDAVVSGNQSVAIGQDATASSLGSTAVGYKAEATTSSVAVGRDPSATGTTSVAVGYQAKAEGNDSLSVGRSGRAAAHYSVSINTNWNQYGVGSIGIGYYAINGNALGEANYSIAIGADTSAMDTSVIALGYYSRVPNGARWGVAIGPGAQCDIEGGIRANGIPYLAKDPDAHTDEYFPGWSGDLAVPRASRQSASQVVIATDTLDLTDDSDEVELAMPAGATLFMDALDVVVVDADGAGGSPEITLGTTSGGTDILASQALSKTAAGGRETFSPLLEDGVASVFVNVVTAGTGTSYQARVVVCGYVMEL